MILGADPELALEVVACHHNDICLDAADQFCFTYDEGVGDALRNVFKRVR